MAKISPIAEYLRVNKAISKCDKYGCDFISPNGLYLGRLNKVYVDNYRVITLDVFGDGLKKMYTKSVAFGQQFIYVKNPKSPIGVSLVPFKTYMRKVFVDFIDGNCKIVDSEKNLANKLDLIAYDEASGVGLYETDKPIRYKTCIKGSKLNKLKKPLFKFISN